MTFDEYIERYADTSGRWPIVHFIRVTTDGKNNLTFTTSYDANLLLAFDPETHKLVAAYRNFEDFKNE